MSFKVRKQFAQVSNRWVMCISDAITSRRMQLQSSTTTFKTKNRYVFTNLLGRLSTLLTIMCDHSGGGFCPRYGMAFRTEDSAILRGLHIYKL